MKSIRLGTSMLCVGLAVLTVTSGCSESASPAPPPPKVAVIKAQTRDVPLTRQLVGRLSAYYSANVTARVSGVLLKRGYKEGSQVRAGQLLFQIDPTFYKTQLDSDLALLAEDKATYVNARITAERNRKLLPVGSVSQQTADNTDATERSAAAKVLADEAIVQSAHVNLDYTRVSSPIDGIAGQQLVTEGATVGSSTNDAGSGGTLLTTVQRVDPIYANFTISASDLVALHQAQRDGAVALSKQDQTTIQIALPDGSPYGSTGKLDFSDVAVNSTTGAVNLRALVSNPQQVLLPGMYLNLTVSLGRQNNVILVPQQALQRDTIGAFLYAVGAGNKVVRKDVTASDSLNNEWIVTSGLHNGDLVIVTGLQSVHEGQTVKVSPWQPPESALDGSGSVRQAARTGDLSSPGASAAPASLPLLAVHAGNAQ